MMNDEWEPLLILIADWVPDSHVAHDFSAPSAPLR
jgi:hypothetical protein